MGEWGGARIRYHVKLQASIIRLRRVRKPQIRTTRLRRDPIIPLRIHPWLRCLRKNAKQTRHLLSALLSELHAADKVVVQHHQNGSQSWINIVLFSDKWYRYEASLICRFWLDLKYHCSTFPCAKHFRSIPHFHHKFYEAVIFIC